VKSGYERLRDECFRTTTVNQIGTDKLNFLCMQFDECSWAFLTTNYQRRFTEPCLSPFDSKTASSAKLECCKR